MLPAILLLGATGRTGRLVLEEALNRGHSVTALVRKQPSNLPEHELLTVVTGDPCKEADVAKALSQMAAKSAIPVPVVVISTLGQTRRSGNPWAAPTSPPRFMASAMQAVLDASSPSSTHNDLDCSVPVQKLVVMSMFGAGDSFANLNFLMRWIMRSSNMAQTLEDQNLVDEVVRKKGAAGELALPFVLVRPAMLNCEEDAMPVIVYPSSGQGAGFMPSVSTKSVALFLLDAAVKDDFDGMAPVIAN